MKTDEVRDFVKAFIVGIEEGIKEGKDNKYFLKDEIEFDLSIVKTKSAKGGARILIADIEGEYDNQKISRVKFTICTKLGYMKDYVLKKGNR